MGLIWTLLLVLFLRAFVVEPFRIPSGSMIPTLLEGDFLFVGKSSYDIGIPFTNLKLLHVAEPRNGDVVVFEYPNHENDESRKGLYYIKRIIGLPGDKILMKAGILYINGKEIAQQPYPDAGPKANDIAGFSVANANDVFFEELPKMEAPHYVQRNREIAKQLPSYIEQYRQNNPEKCFPLAASMHLQSSYKRPIAMNEICEFTVPPDQFFCMGDNREDSADGREWGYVDRNLLKGRALFIWMSLQQGGPDQTSDSRGPLANIFRWSRFGLSIN